MLPDNMSDLNKTYNKPSIKLFLSKTFIRHCWKHGKDISNRILPESQVRVQLGISKENVSNSKESLSNTGYCTGAVSSSRDPGLILEKENLQHNFVVPLPKSISSKSEATVHANFDSNFRYIKLSEKEKQDYILTLIIITSMKTITDDDAVLDTLTNIQCGLAKLLKINDEKSKLYSKENLPKMIEETFSTFTGYSDVLNATFKIVVQKEDIAAAMNLLCSSKLDMKHSLGSSKDTPRIKGIRGIKIIRYVAKKIVGNHNAHHV